MASPSVNKHVSDDNQHCDEPTTFPYLLTLVDDIKLLEDEPLEMMAPEEEAEESSPNPMAARMFFTTGKTTEILRVNPTHNLTITTPTTASSTATTPVATSTNKETGYATEETLSTILTQLAGAQEEITSLRHHAEQRDMRILEYEQRLLTMENTVRQLMQLHPTIQNTFHKAGDSLAQMTQHSDPAEEDVGAKVLDNKRKREGNFNNPTRQQTKRPNIVKADVTRSREKEGCEGHMPHCPNCNYHHQGSYCMPCGRCSLFGHQAKNCRFPITVTNPNTPKACFECGDTRHLRNNCPKLENRNNNKNKKKKTHGRIFVNNTGGAGPKP